MSKNLGGRPARYFVVIDGVHRRADEVAKEVGINRNTLYHRIQNGVPKEKWFVKAGELTEQAKIVWNGQEFTIHKFARQHGLHHATVKYRIDVGKSGTDLIAAPHCMVDDHQGEHHCEVHNWKGIKVPHQRVVDAGVSVDTARCRVHGGCSIERALLPGCLSKRTQLQMNLLDLGIVS